MITGDYHHTAIAVAKDVGMIKSSGKVVVIDAASKPEPAVQSSSASLVENIDRAQLQRLVASSTIASDHQSTSPRWQPDRHNDRQTVGHVKGQTQRDLIGQTDSLMHGHMIGQTDGHINWHTDRQMTGQTDGHMKGQADVSPDASAASSRHVVWGGVQQRDATLTEASAAGLSDSHSDARQTSHAAARLLESDAMQGNQTALSLSDPDARQSNQAAASLPDSDAMQTSHAAASMSELDVRQTIHAPAAVLHARKVARSPSCMRLGRYQQLLQDLKFMSSGQGALAPADALSALAEGQMQCAVTGDAFQFLLHHHDLSLLETVMHSAVVFSRMQPHQKGLVMDLLGTRGIHQIIAGQPLYVEVNALSCCLAYLHCQKVHSKLMLNTCCRAVVSIAVCAHEED